MFTSVSTAGSNTLRIQSTFHTASDVAQTVLPGVAAVAGVIPVAGGPLQAAIGGLLFILQGIDVRAPLVTMNSSSLKGYHREVSRINKA